MGAADSSTTPPRRAHRPALRDRVLAGLARFLVRCFYRSIEVEGPLPRSGRVILAASHLNGFVDPVVMTARLGVLPRFLAKATLWDVKVARPLLSFARLIPVYRRVDAGDGKVDNSATFSAAVDALAGDHLVAIFPEGTTHDDPAIRELHTGVARIALQALASGLPDVTIIPVGITYEDKVAVRGRALVSFGPPLRLHADVDAPAGDDHAEVRALTQRLTDALRGVTPPFDSLDDALGLQAAAETTLRTDARPVPVAATLDLSRRLVAAGPEEIDEVVTTAARYQVLLDHVRLTDEELVGDTGLRHLTRRLVGLALLVVLLAPFAAAGLLVNLLPATLVLVAGLVPRAPVSKGTIRFLVAMIAFPLTWLGIAVWDGGDGWLAGATRGVTFPAEPLMHAAFSDREGVTAGIIVFLAAPLFGAATLVLVDRIRALLKGLLVWRTTIDRRGQLPAVRARRAELVAVTSAAAAGTRRPAGAPQPLVAPTAEAAVAPTPEPS